MSPHRPVATSPGRPNAISPGRPNATRSGRPNATRSGQHGAMSPRRHGAVRTRRRGDRGSVTVELAVGLPALVLLLFAALTAVSAVVTKLECVDAAREAARAAARGEPGEPAGRRVAPDGAVVTVRVEGETVRATVSSRVRPLGPYLPGIPVTAAAVAEREPGVGP